MLTPIQEADAKAGYLKWKWSKEYSAVPNREAYNSYLKATEAEPAYYAYPVLHVEANAFMEEMTTYEEVELAFGVKFDDGDTLVFLLVFLKATVGTSLAEIHNIVEGIAWEYDPEMPRPTK